MTDEVIALAAVFAVGTDGCSDVTCEEDVDTVFGTAREAFLLIYFITFK